MTARVTGAYFTARTRHWGGSFAAVLIYIYHRSQMGQDLAVTGEDTSIY